MEFAMTDITDAGVLTTASDLLFSGGREGFFYALDARTGALLLEGAGRRNRPGSPWMSYAIGNRVCEVIALAIRFTGHALKP